MINVYDATGSLQHEMSVYEGFQTQPNRSKIEREPRVGFMRQRRMPCGFVGDRLQNDYSKEIRVRFRLLCHACLSSWQ